MIGGKKLGFVGKIKTERLGEGVNEETSSHQLLYHHHHHHLMKLPQGRNHFLHVNKIQLQ